MSFLDGNNSQPYVTELDLRQSLIPAALIDHLATIMPKHPSGEGYDYERFLDTLVNGTSSSNAHISICSDEKSDERWNKTRQEPASSQESSSETDYTRARGGMARSSRHYL